MITVIKRKSRAQRQADEERQRKSEEWERARPKRSDTESREDWASISRGVDAPLWDEKYR